MAKRTWVVRDPVFVADRVCPMMPVWPWGGHRNFAYDLVRWMRPAQIAELGVHWGTSFFAFAQAAKDARIPCRLIGVDTFEGDPHAGQYGDEVYDTVRAIIARFFPRLSITLHRSLFLEALAHVADDSCDLIHIDGLHTYEAVQEDFTTWLPKLAPDGVMLFHDTAPSTGYGSADFWRDISAERPSFAFTHSWGLGVLFPKGDRRLREMQAQGLEDKIALYTHKANADLLRRQLADTGRMAQSRFETIEKQRSVLEGRDAAIARLRADLESARTQARERMAALERQSEMIRSRTSLAENLRVTLDALRASSKEHVERLTARVEELKDHVRRREESVHAAKNRIARLEAARDESRERAASLSREVVELRRRINEAEAMNARLSERLDALSRRTDEIEAAGAETRSTLASELAEIREALHAVERRMKGHHARLSQADADAELMQIRAEHVERVVADLRRRLGALDNGAWTDDASSQRSGAAQ
ncbi:MAG: class I SAM-dependent methyltransferase [Phycisphaeraceae bacterium]|nr:class I SAM-dependent methyltransferase [Phycisphaeraceae bacterium]